MYFKSYSMLLVKAPFDYTKHMFSCKATYSYSWISLIADIGGWTGTLIGVR
jgi:hypothetical protein